MDGETASGDCNAAPAECLAGGSAAGVVGSQSHLLGLSGFLRACARVCAFPQLSEVCIIVIAVVIPLITTVSVKNHKS